ncbi:MAG: ROK family protein [Bacillota bacterium]|nr:ROK family protein [Bacillota bacterium]
MLSLGVDIGGTKIAAGIINEQGFCIDRIELPSISDDSEKMFSQVKNSISMVLKKGNYKLAELAGIGIGVPGKVEHQNGVAIYQNNLPWINFPLVERLQEFFPAKILLDNDVYMATFGEWYAAGKKYDETFVFFTISTGISCCTIHNGRFVRGAGFAGEIGLSIVDEHPLPSKYLNDGCLEAVASGPAIAHYTNIHRNLSGGSDKWTTKEVIDAYFSGEPFVIEIIQNIFRYIARGIHSITCLLDPDKLILGGGVMNHNPKLIHPLLEELDKLLVPEQKNILHRIQASKLKGDAGIIGAGLRVLEDFS